MAAMFDGIAATYDKVNSIGSLGLDGYWRRRLVARLGQSGAMRVLDAACGTGVLSWMIFSKLKIKVIGLDISTKMLQRAEKRGESQKFSGETPIFIEGRAEELPFDDQSFDAVTIAFGIRNFENRAVALLEVYRVLKRGGSLSILEFATPRNPLWKFIFGIYFFHLLPLLGYVVSGKRNAYRYLPRSVGRFPQYEEFNKEILDVGFSDVGYKAYTGGVAVLYSAIKK
ncbi:MAG: ubiquinone/menaquinone biosynthesis methyltransferase [Prevotellaceae bacterium]|nr:ubiquinone/menaquinone biosynthesis methyltransferase [Prevotellaceae bacterium]